MTNRCVGVVVVIVVCFLMREIERTDNTMHACILGVVVVVTACSFFVAGVYDCMGAAYGSSYNIKP